MILHKIEEKIDAVPFRLWTGLGCSLLWAISSMFFMLVLFGVIQGTSQKNANAIGTFVIACFFGLTALGCTISWVYNLETDLERRRRAEEVHRGHEALQRRKSIRAMEAELGFPPWPYDDDIDQHLGRQIGRLGYARYSSQDALYEVRRGIPPT